MSSSLFTPKQKNIVLLRTLTYTLPQISDHMNEGFNHINNCNRAIHEKVGRLTGLQDKTGILVLGVSVAIGEITPRDLQLVFAMKGIRL